MIAEHLIQPNAIVRVCNEVYRLLACKHSSGGLWRAANKRTGGIDYLLHADVQSGVLLCTAKGKRRHTSVITFVVENDVNQERMRESILAALGPGGTLHEGLRQLGWDGDFNVLQFAVSAPDRTAHWGLQNFDTKG